MIGVVFAGEMKRASRGRLAHWTRWILGAWLAIVLTFACASIVSPSGLLLDSAGLAARNLVDTVTFQIVIAVLLAGPAFAAGAVADEKIRGTLELLFLTDVGAASIVLGKLLARVAQGFVWSLTAWPIIAMAGVPGGVTPSFFLCLAIVTILMLAGTCGLTLLFSVWARQARNAAIAMYSLVCLIAVPTIAYLEANGSTRPLAKFVMSYDPMYLLDAARDQPDVKELRERLATTTTAWGLIAIPSVLIATWRLRPVYFKQQQRSAQPRWLRRWTTRPPIGDRPVAWVERFSYRRVPLGLGLFATVVVTSVTLLGLRRAFSPVVDFDELFAGAAIMSILFCAIVAGARASSCVKGERDRKTWESLIATPVSFQAIMREKCQGIVQSVWPYFFACFIPASLSLSLAELIRGWSATGVCIWLGLFLPAIIIALVLPRVFGQRWSVLGWTMVAATAAAYSGPPMLLALIVPIFAYSLMCYMSGIGAWFSVRAKNNWLSLLGTMAGGLAFGTVVTLASSPFGCLSCCLTGPLIGLLSSAFGGWSGSDAELITAIAIWVMTSTFGFTWIGFQLAIMAARYLDQHDRIPGGFVRAIDLDLPRSGMRRVEDN